MRWSLRSATDALPLLVLDSAPTCEDGKVFDSLGRLVARAPRTVIAVWVALTLGSFALAVFGVGGQTLFERLSTGAPAIPGSESTAGDDILRENAAVGESLSLVVEGAPPATEGLAEEVAALRADLAEVEGVAMVIDPFALPGGLENPAAAGLLAADEDGFLVAVDLAPDLTEDEADEALEEVAALLRAAPERLQDVAPGATGRVGGASLIIEAITEQVEKDLQTGEAIALPVALLVMVMVFGGFVAASMPMVGAIASIGAGLGAVYGLSHLLDLDASVVNVVTLLSIGLSIDYGLLIVSRYREELHRLLDEDEAVPHRRRRRDPVVETALRQTMVTAGRTVFYSAVTVAISIAGLLAFQPDILRGFGAAGVVVVLIAVATAMTLVPALLRLTGRRLVRPGLVHRIPGLSWVLQRTGDVSSEEGAFSRLAAWVQRRPLLVMLGTLAVLGFLAIPVFHMELRNSDIELLPAGSDQRVFVETLADDYPASEAPPIRVVADGTGEEVASWAEELTAIPEVASVDPPAQLGAYVVLGVRPDTEDGGGPVARDAVQALRDLDPPFETWVTGQAANQIDFTQALVDRAPLAIGVVVVATFVLLFLMT
ncbi:MAG: MMPL family transporter, partial [Actinotalea sp.]|nr:MMPL family transporter [Actinotalea sp.]